MSPAAEFKGALGFAFWKLESSRSAEIGIIEDHTRHPPFPKARLYGRGLLYDQSTYLALKVKRFGQ
jgi:hypothetical protein